MRVAMASYGFNLQGGIERSSYEIANRLAGLGEEITLVSHTVDPEPRPPVRWQRVRLRATQRAIVPVTFSRAATAQLDYDRFDLVHNQGGCAARRQDVITAHSCHRAWWQLKKEQGELARAYLNPLHHTILHVERANYRPGAFRQVIAVSEGVKRELSRWYDVPAERVTVIPNGVDVEQFWPADREAVRSRLRSRHGFHDQDVVLLFVGKEFRRKGLGPIIDALPALPDQVHLLVVGGDNQEPFVQRARELGVAPRVTFVGHSDAVHDYFQAADVFVFPTLYEAFALVTLEAAAAGLPLVTTRVNGTEDFVDDGVTGRFVERDAGSVAAVISGLVEDPELRARLGSAARAKVQAFTWDEAAERTREVYAALAERGHQR